MKTIKDIKEYLYPGQNNITVIRPAELKQVAIEWIKDPPEGYFNSSDHHVDVIRWIIDFFNLTEEDLK